MKSKIFLIFILFLVNNLLHNISEKVIIVVFIIIFFLLTKVLSAIISNNYISRSKVILHDVNVYINTLLTMYYNKKNNLFTNLSLNFAFKKLSVFLIDYSRKLIKKHFYYLIKSK